MRCPDCRAATHVLDTRSAGDDVIRRRRECLRCGHRFTTHELVKPAPHLVRREFERAGAA